MNERDVLRQVVEAFDTYIDIHTIYPLMNAVEAARAVIAANQRLVTVKVLARELNMDAEDARERLGVKTIHCRVWETRARYELVNGRNQT